MSNYKYRLEPYAGRATRHTCPKCKERYEFVRYINSETLEHVGESVGKCNRSDNCGYHLPPSDFFRLKKNSTHVSIRSHSAENGKRYTKALTPPSTVSADLVAKTLRCYEQNNLIVYLRGKLGHEAVDIMLQRYRIGTTKRGETVFWLHDFEGNARNGQIIPYDATTGRRLKNAYPPVSWVHTKMAMERTKNCFFGEHLLALEPTKPVAIVEAPKTALIASIYYPQYVWLSTCGKHGCSWSDRTVSSVLAGRKVYLFPDLGFDKGANKTTCEIWREKTCDLNKIGIDATVVDILETVATACESQDGLDLADFLLQYSPHDFTRNNLPVNIQRAIAHLFPQTQDKIAEIVQRFGLSLLE